MYAHVDVVDEVDFVDEVDGVDIGCMGSSPSTVTR